MMRWGRAFGDGVGAVADYFGWIPAVEVQHEWVQRRRAVVRQDTEQVWGWFVEAYHQGVGVLDSDPEVADAGVAHAIVACAIYDVEQKGVWRFAGRLEQLQPAIAKVGCQHPVAIGVACIAAQIKAIGAPIAADFPALGHRRHWPQGTRMIADQALVECSVNLRLERDKAT